MKPCNSRSISKTPVSRALNVHAIRRAYQHIPLPEAPWLFARKHFRIELLNGVFVKWNRFENRTNAWELRCYLRKHVPQHAFMSVTGYLFPERARCLKRGWRVGHNPSSVLGGIQLSGLPASFAEIMDAYLPLHPMGQPFHRFHLIPQ